MAESDKAIDEVGACLEEQSLGLIESEVVACHLGCIICTASILRISDQRVVVGCLLLRDSTPLCLLGQGQGPLAAVALCQANSVEL